MKHSLKVGDTIECKDVEDMVDTMEILVSEHIDVEFVYEKDGEKGYWLEVISVGVI